MARTDQHRTAAQDMFERDLASNGLGIELIEAGDLLEAVAAERATTGRSGIYDVTVTCDGDIVAEFRGCSRVLSPGGPA